MMRGVSGQDMTDRSVGSADATPESRVRRAPSAAARKLLHVREESVGVNHRMTVWGDRSR